MSSEPTIAFRLPPESLHQLAAAVAPLIAELLAPAPRDDGYLDPEGAARYLCRSRKRIYDLKSMGALTPDGYDGRTPLFSRATLDSYVRAVGVR